MYRLKFIYIVFYLEICIYIRYKLLEIVIKRMIWWFVYGNVKMLFDGIGNNWFKLYIFIK